MEEYFGLVLSALDEYLATLTAALYRRDDAYRSTREAMEALCRAYPWLEELYDPALVRAVTEEEYAVLQTYLQHQTDAAMLDRRAAYCRGCYDAIGFLRRAGVL